MESRSQLTANTGNSGNWDWSAIRSRCKREAWRLLRDPDDAEEVVQEALVRAWRGRDTCRSTEARLAWCLQITRNEAYRLMARRRPLPELVSLDNEAAPSANLADRSNYVDSVVTTVDVRRALARLEDDEQELIALRYSNDLSQPEIARALNIPEGTAKVRLHRARKRLEAILEPPL